MCKWSKLFGKKGTIYSFHTACEVIINVKFFRKNTMKEEIEFNWNCNKILSKIFYRRTSAKMTTTTIEIECIVFIDILFDDWWRVFVRLKFDCRYKIDWYTRVQCNSHKFYINRFAMNCISIEVILLFLVRASSLDLCLSKSKCIFSRLGNRLLTFSSIYCNL